MITSTVQAQNINITRFITPAPAQCFYGSKVVGGRMPPPKKTLSYDENGLIKTRGLICQGTRYAQARPPAQIVKFYQADDSRLLEF